jgi:hypothetical protein
MVGPLKLSATEALHVLICIPGGIKRCAKLKGFVLYWSIGKTVTSGVPYGLRLKRKQA